MKRFLAFLLALTLIVGVLSLSVFAGNSVSPEYEVNGGYLLGSWHGEYHERPSLVIGKIDAVLNMNITKFEPDEVSSNGYYGAWYADAYYSAKVNNIVLKELVDKYGGKDGVLEGTIGCRIWLDPVNGKIVSVSSLDSNANLFDYIEEYATVNSVLSCSGHTVNAKVNMSYGLISLKAGMELKQEVPTSGHYALLHTPFSPACLADGTVENWRCSICGKSYADAECTVPIPVENTVVPAIGHHTLQHFPAVAATVESDGNIEYWFCSECGKYFSDEACAAEISLSDTVIPKIIPYYITYELDGGENSPSNPAYVLPGNAAVSLEAPTKEGFIFMGWYLDAALTQPAPSPEIRAELTEDMTFYARWSPVGSIILSMDDAAGHSGRQLRVPVSISGNSALASVSFKIEYDHSVLKLVGFEDGIMTGWSVGIGGDEKASWSADADFCENGTVLTLIFEAAEGVTAGDTFISLTELLGSDHSGNLLEPVSDPAFVRLTDRCPGDVNGDGLVNASDLLRLKKYLARLPVEISESNADVTGGDGVGAEDLLRLKKYLAGLSTVLE